MSTMTIQEGAIVTELFILGPRDVRVLTVNCAMNTALIQFRDLDQTPTPQNTYTTVLNMLQPRAR